MIKNNGRIKQAEFQMKVLTHLDYIKQKQDEHDNKLDKLNDKMDARVEVCAARFNKIESDVDTAKGYAKGLGGSGFIAGVLSLIKGFF